MPSLGVAKRNVKTELLPDGSANVTFEFNLENFGNVDLSDISLLDDLSAPLWHAVRSERDEPDQR